MKSSAFPEAGGRAKEASPAEQGTAEAGRATGGNDAHASAFERLLAAIEEHATKEQGAIVSYHTLAADFADPVLVQIMSLIAEDEERHHRVLRQMALVVRGNEAAWPAAAAPARRSGLAPSEIAATIGILRAALRDETVGIRELRSLARAYGDRYGGLFALLFELMALDSRKHARMLRFVVRQLRAEQRAVPVQHRSSAPLP